MNDEKYNNNLVMLSIQKHENSFLYWVDITILNHKKYRRRLCISFSYIAW